MSALATHHAAVWLDELAPEGGAFPHAVEWAARLGLPLYGITSALRPGGGRLTGVCPAGTLMAEKLEDCASVCARQGVPWNASLDQASLSAGVDPFGRPPALCIFGDALPRRLKERLLRLSRHSTGSAVLVGARSWRPVSRVLVVYEQWDADQHFLDGAAEVCRVFGLAPVVLTLARTEREARSRRRIAEERFAARGQPADFDFVVGCDTPAAVAWLARWRRCSHVFVERRKTSLWQRLRGDTLERLLRLSDSLTFLALPGTAPAAPPATEVAATTAAPRVPGGG
jgi:hypothetical protein